MKAFIVKLCLLISASVYSSNDVSPNIDTGARVYQERCVLCHGTAAMGEGILPLKIKDYPNTNLIKAIVGKTREEIQYSIIYGGSEGKLSKYMPPMGNDLTWTQTVSVIDFVMLLQSDREKALALLETTRSTDDISWKVGQQLYDSRCALCHGKFGEGDGRMAKVLKDPPPANLVKSRVPENYMREIIKRGGEAMGRSPKMPPWGMQFSDDEISSIVIYLQTLRQ